MQQINSSWAEQELQEAKAKRRARHAHEAAQRRIKEVGKESALPYGQALFDITIEPVAASIAKDFEQFVLDPKSARKFAAVLPLFDHFDNPTHVAAIALVAVLDQLLSESEYLVDDDFSVADVAVCSYLNYVPLFFPSVRLNSPNIVNYMRRCAERPAFAKAFGGGHAQAVLAACDNAGSSGGEKLFGLF